VILAQWIQGGCWASMRANAGGSDCRRRWHYRGLFDHESVTTDTDTVTLWRPTGPEELALVEASGWREWPPRLPGQLVCTTDQPRDLRMSARLGGDAVRLAHMPTLRRSDSSLLVRTDFTSGGKPPFRCIPPELWSVENNLNIANRTGRNSRARPKKMAFFVASASDATADPRHVASYRSSA
ncbi:MAG TPA: hypothetical protein VIV12_18685, partial [Streptosporangiaceae bacterium]